MITFPNAKINLGLAVTGKRPDGYHNIETVFYPISLEDALEVVEACDAKRKVTLNASGMPMDCDPGKNLITKAYELLDRDFGLPPVEIFIHKGIPSGAGLGGGSADAAFTLKLLNDKFGLSLTGGQLEGYASSLGADCPFFIRNKPVLARGTGNVFSPVSISLGGYTLLLVKPRVSVSTRDAFASVSPGTPAYSLEEVVQRPVREWKGVMVNDFEDGIFRQYPVIGKIKEKMYGSGAVYASMSGSGSSVYGLFEQGVEPLADEFGDEFGDVFSKAIKCVSFT